MDFGKCIQTILNDYRTAFNTIAFKRINMATDLCKDNYFMNVLFGKLLSFLNNCLQCTYQQCQKYIPLNIYYGNKSRVG